MHEGKENLEQPLIFCPSTDSGQGSGSPASKGDGHQGLLRQRCVTCVAAQFLKEYHSSTSREPDIDIHEL